MIIYTTKQTRERYDLKMPNEFSDPAVRAFVEAVCEKERGDRLLEWGAKLFYFDRRKCLQVCNFASKFTLVLADLKMDDVVYVGEAIARYMTDIYSENRDMTALLKRFFSEHPICCFSKLTDKSIIASLNHMQTHYLDDGYRLYDYIENNILHTKKLNRFINTRYLAREKVNGKTDFFFPAEKFEQLLKERYGKR